MTRYLIPPTPPEDLPPLPPTPQDVDIPDEAYAARTAFGWLAPGETLDPICRQEADRANAVRAQELHNQYIDRQRQVLSTGPDAFLTRQGRDAVLGASDVLSRLNDARQDVLDRTANNMQRRLLQTALDHHAIGEHAGIGDHAGRQSLAWQREVATGRLDQLRQQAALDHADPGAIEAYASASESAARERARTLNLAPGSADALREVEGARSSIWRAAIEAAVSSGNIGRVVALHESSKKAMTPADAAIVGRLVGAAHEQDIARQYLSTIVPEAELPSTFADIDDAHEEASAHNDNDWGHDPDLWGTIQHFIDVLFISRRREVMDEEAGLDQSIQDWLGKYMPDGQAQTDLPPVELWSRLDPGRQKFVREALKQNAWSSAQAPRRSLLTLVSGIDDEKEKDELFRKLLHRPVHRDDIEHPHPHEIAPPLGPSGAGRLPGFRSPTPAGRPSASNRPASKTLPEKFTSNREELRNLDPEHPELSRDVPSPTHDDLTIVRKILNSIRLKIHGPRGRQSEKRVLKDLQLEPNKHKVYSQEGASIPDALTKELLVEIKDRAYVTMTKQLRIQAAFAKATGRKAILYIGEHSLVSECVKRNFLVLRRTDLGPEK